MYVFELYLGRNQLMILSRWRVACCRSLSACFGKLLCISSARAFTSLDLLAQARLYWFYHGLLRLWKRLRSKVYVGARSSSINIKLVSCLVAVSVLPYWRSNVHVYNWKRRVWDILYRLFPHALQVSTKHLSEWTCVYFYTVACSRVEPRWSLSKIATESLASCMLVTILLDLCRLVIGQYGLKNEFCM